MALKPLCIIWAVIVLVIASGRYLDKRTTAAQETRYNTENSLRSNYSLQKARLDSIRVEYNSISERLAEQTRSADALQLIANSMPKEIQALSMRYGLAPSTRTREVQIIGTTKSSRSLREFVELLERKSSVSAVNLKNVAKADTVEGANYKFEIVVRTIL